MTRQNNMVCQDDAGPSAGAATMPVTRNSDMMGEVQRIEEKVPTPDEEEMRCRNSSDFVARFFLEPVYWPPVPSDSRTRASGPARRRMWSLISPTGRPSLWIIRAH